MLPRSSFSTASNIDKSLDAINALRRGRDIDVPAALADVCSTEQGESRHGFEGPNFEPDIKDSRSTV